MPHIALVRLVGLSTSLAALTIGTLATAQDAEVRGAESPAQDYADTIIVTGTRRTDRTIADSPVPIDIIGQEALQNNGATETNRLLNQLVPSFNFPQPSLTDGTDSLRPATLRGLAPDQVLVLLNGKRRHMSSLLNLNGSIGRGSAAVDLNTIPALAIERIEILRDGASSLYGSDAIAGVINVRLKTSEGGRAQATYGKYITTLRDVDQVASVSPTTGTSDNPNISFTGNDRKRRDGDTITFAANVGLPVGDVGYFNVTGEYRDREPTNRSGPDLRRQYNTAGDPRETTITRYQHRFGDGKSQDLNFVINAGGQLTDTFELYAFGTYGIRDANGAGFYRRSLDARNRDFANGGQPFYPDGFLPIIASEIRDIAGSVGIRGSMMGFDSDLSLTYGTNQLNYAVENSFNTSLGGLASPRRFDAGGLRSGQTSVNLDLRRDVDFGLDQPISIAIGGEYRDENYRIIAGDVSSYINGPFSLSNNAPGGSQVFPGFRPNNEVDASRDSYAAYVELDTDIGDAFNVQAAGRYEHFSDFGNTVNGKVAARFEPIDGIAIRGSISTGFRAPGLAQQFFATTSTNNIGTQLVEVGTFPVNSPVALALGSQPLDAEKSLNFGGGVALSVIDGLSLTADYYNIRINDRITLTENLQGADIVATLLAAGIRGVTSARFFINGIDTRTQGLDVVGSYRVPDLGVGTIRLTAGFNISDTKIIDRRTFAGFTAERLFARQESFRLTDGQPANKINIGLDWDYGIVGFTARANRYGNVFLPSSVAANRNDITVAKGDAAGDITLGEEWVADLELRVKPGDALELAIGANNVFDAYPDRLPFGTVDGVNFGLNNSFLPYSSQSPFGFSGRFLYGRVAVTF